MLDSGSRRRSSAASGIVWWAPPLAYPGLRRAGRRRLQDVQGQIAVMFRALGGEAGVSSPARSPKSGHRSAAAANRPRRRELDSPAATARPSSCRTASPCFRIASSTPRSIAGWPRGSPRRRVAASDEIDPLRRDIMTLRRARETVRKVHALLPGPVRRYERLAAARARAPAQAAAAGRAEVERTRWRCSVPPRPEGRYGRP